MYGREDEDPVVQYYDETLAVSDSKDIEWYLYKVKMFGGPVLDLACGTGRVALFIAQQGYKVVGIDSSEGMLTLFRRKLSEQQRHVQERISLHKEEMSHFDINQKFRTIICCDAFFHNTTVEEEIDCLLCVARHLTPEGRVLFNIPNPTLELLTQWAHPEGQKFRERKTYCLTTGETLLIEESNVSNLSEQTVETRLRYTKIGKGKLSEPEESSWKIRYMFQYEAVHLLSRCGFQIESLVGDYDNGPVTGGSQLIFQAQYNPFC